MSRGEEGPFIQTLGGHTPRIDPGAYVHPRAVLIGQVRVGAESSIWPCATLRGDDSLIAIGARTSVQDGAVIHTTDGLSETVVGDQVTVGHNVTLHGARVGDNCIIGMGSIILDNAEIGEFCIIGAGSLVTMNKVIPPYSLVLGSPARVVRELTAADLEQIDFSWRHYVKRCHMYLAQAGGV